MYRKICLLFLILGGLCLVSYGQGQCPRNPDIDFRRESSGRCNPVQIETFEVAWDNIPFGVTTVQVSFDWGDGETEIVDANLISAGTFGNQWSALADHFYDEALAECAYTAIATIILDGTPCDDSQLEQTIYVYDDDNSSGGNLLINPQNYQVCAGNEVTLNFEDVSQFNCVPPDVEQETANGFNRWTQFIYNTGPSDIDGVEIVDELGFTVTTLNATDPEFFGEVEYQTDPENFLFASNAVSNNIIIPSTAQVGEVFEITLRNWNICNPYDADLSDGNPLNPADMINGDSLYVETTALVTIVASPTVSIATNNPTNVFCLGEQIRFNSTVTGVGNMNYFFEFFDDSVGTNRVGTRTNANPSFTYNNPGKKKVKVTVVNADAFGTCAAVDSMYILMAPNDIADIQVLDESGVPYNTNTFCFTGDPVNIIYADSTTENNINPSWRWEFQFFDNSRVEYPSNEFYSDTKVPSFQSGTDFMNFTNPGVYSAKLFVIDSANGCFTEDSVAVIIDQPPVAAFSSINACSNEPLILNSNSTLNSNAGAVIDSLYWDFDFSASFFQDTVKTSSEWQITVDSAGIYPVALVAKSSLGCRDTVVANVEVSPLPNADITADTLEGCTDLSINFENLSIGSQPDSIIGYTWFVNESGGFEIDSIQLSGQVNFRRIFTNNSSVNTQAQLFLQAETEEGCVSVSDTLTVTIFPAPKLGFIDLNYDVFSLNCSPLVVDFEVDADTRSLNSDQFIWSIMSDTLPISTDTLPATDPDYQFTFTNDSAFLQDYTITLSAIKPNVCFRDSSLLIRVNPVPSSAFDAQIIEENCDFVRVSIQAEELGLPLSRYSWAFSEDPINSNFIVFDGQYEAEFPQLPTDYTVEIQLQTRNSFNCTSTVTSYELLIPGKEQRILQLDLSDNGICPPDDINYINNSTGFSTTTTYTILQKLGNATTDTVMPSSGELENSFFVNYEVPGTYLVTFIAEDEDCRIDTTLNVEVFPVADARFRTNIDSGCAPLEPILVENSTNQPVIASKSWTVVNNFNNQRVYGPSAVIPNGLVNYGNQNPDDITYSIALTVTTLDGCVDDTVRDVLVHSDVTPIFTATPEIQTLPSSIVTFNNQTVDGNGFNYIWSFGNEQDSAFIRNPPPLDYGTFGEFEIILEVSSANCEGRGTQSIRIIPSNPVADFSFSPPEGCEPLRVDFENRSQSVDPDSFFWNFGDGVGTSTAENPSYIYNEPGRYTVSLSASNPAGASVIEIKEEVIEVFPRPTAIFQVNPDTVYLPSEPVYTTNLSLDAQFFRWEFGDGAVYTQPEPIHIYGEEGIYDISLIAETDRGCIDTLIRETAVTVLEGGDIQVPNIFTPSFDGPSGGFIGNGGGVGAGSNNNVFMPRTEGVEEFNMLIYNRWGELIFESRNVDQGWDGYDKDGKLCPQDVYLYKLNLRFSNGREEVKVGDVTLLR